MENTNTDTRCPHCGAEQINKGDRFAPIYDCGSWQEKPRTDLCREREAHNKTREEIEHIKKLLKDIPAVHINMLRGNIAKLSWDSYEHIIGPHPCREKLEKSEAENARLTTSLKEVCEIADHALRLAEIDYENDKFGVVTSLRAELEDFK